MATGFFFFRDDLAPKLFFFKEALRLHNFGNQIGEQGEKEGEREGKREEEERGRVKRHT